AAHLAEGPPRLDARVDVHPPGTGRLGQAEQPDVEQHLAGDQRHVDHLRPPDAGVGVEVDAQLVGVVEVGRVNGVRVQLETAEVDHPGQLRRVTQDDLVGRAPGRVAQLGRLDPAGPVGRRALLKTRLAVDAVDVALHRHRPAPGTAQRAVGHGQVVAHDVELRVAGLR